MFHRELKKVIGDRVIAEVAHGIGVKAPPMIFNWLNGKQTPTLDQFDRLTRYLELDVDEDLRLTELWFKERMKRRRLLSDLDYLDRKRSKYMHSNGSMDRISKDAQKRAQDQFDMMRPSHGEFEPQLPKEIFDLNKKDFETVEKIIKDHASEKSRLRPILHSSLALLD